MTNAYYNRSINQLPAQRVGSSDLKNEFQSIAGGFDGVAADVARAVKLPEGTADQTISLSAGARANLVLAFDSAGNITAISYGRWRGDWATATAYVVSDYFRDSVSKNVYAVVAGHTSGVLATDIAASRVQLAINVADVEAAKSAAETAAATATTQAGLAADSASAANISKLAAQDAQAAAEAVVASIPDGTINDATVSLLSVWSSSKVNGELIASGRLPRSARTSNTVLGTADKGTLIDITSGTFTQTFSAVATLGDGWWCYLRNSGTGDITLDPNASETIDGLTSYVMYPGEVRLVQCDGSALRSIVLNTFYKTFPASGSFIKPPGYSVFSGLLWAAGASGSKGAYPPGGGGGACTPFQVSAAALGSTETVVIGASATGPSAANTAGITGNDSSFFGLVSKGGQAGTGTSNGSSGAAGGNSYGSYAALAGNGFSGGAGATNAGVVAGTSIYGGGGSGAPTSAGVNPRKGGGSVYGGGGGGAAYDPSSSYEVGGTSIFGGNGGTATSSTPGGDGVAPGGGGGGTVSGSKAGDGARGELRIWGVI